jgi:hypothetical protein
MHGIELAINAFLGGLIAIAVIATLVRPGSQTPAVLQSSGSAIGTSLYAAQGIHA